MESREHAAVGAVVATASVPVLWPAASLPLAAALWLGGVALSVLVDLDHFVVARLLVGDWRHARRVLGQPLALLGDQSWVFPDTTLDVERLLSHALVVGAVVPATWLVAPRLGAYVAVLLYVHVLADLLRENGIA